MKPTARFALFFALLAIIGTAQAQDSSTVSSTTETSSELKADLKKATSAPLQDPDEEITNARLRAATGAKAKVSLQTSFTYSGSSVDHPLAKERPQLTPGTVENDPAKLSGRISGKYRMTDHDNFNIGVGIGWLTPSYAGERGQMENPYVSYGRTFKAGKYQHVMSATLMKYTAEGAVNRSKLDYETALDHTVLTTLADGLDAGFAVLWMREFYSQYTGGQLDTIGAFPFAEYSLSKTYSLRTVYRGLTYFNTVAKKGTFVRDDPTQSFGVGVTVARDIYLYPNVQWVWSDMRSEKTNVALTAYINL